VEAEDAGFGGLEVAHRLARAPVRITIIDQRNQRTTGLREVTG
jgi:NADH dehydrogenase FAD-containing subunit